MNTITHITQEWNVGDLIKFLQKYSPETPVCHDFNQIFDVEELYNEETKSIVINLIQ